MSVWSLIQWRDLPLLPLVAGIGVSILIFNYLQNRKKYNLPPGPMGLPLLGIAHQMEDTLNLEVQKQRKKHGDVLSFKIMDDLYVVLSGYKTIREGFMQQGDAFAGGMPYEFNELLGFTNVIPLAFKYDKEWIKNKKIIMAAFRKFGYGSSRFESAMLSNYQKAFSKLQTLNGQPCDIHPMVQIVTSKTISRILFDGKEDGDEEETMNLTLLPYKCMLLTEEAQLALILPWWLSRIVYRSKFKQMDAIIQDFNFKMMLRLEQHQASLDARIPCDLMDILLLNPDQGFTKESILNNMFALLVDSVETVSKVVTSLLLHVTHHPQVQKKIHEELDRVMGASAPVTLSRREDLPYFMATLLEFYRYADFNPIAVPHAAIRDVYLEGYHIPRDSIVIPNIHSIHYDPDIFPDPDIFDPGHFLKDGEIVNENYCFPFGIGKRSCMAEIMVKSEIFLITSNLFLEYEFSFPEDEPKLSLKNRIMFGLSQLPKPFKICAQNRQH